MKHKQNDPIDLTPLRLVRKKRSINWLLQLAILAVVIVIVATVFNAVPIR